MQLAYLNVSDAITADNSEEVFFFEKTVSANQKHSTLEMTTENLNYQYLIAFGSNLGSRRNNIDKAIHEIQKLGKNVCVSNIYETPPLGPADQNFLNGVMTVASPIPPIILLENLLAIETMLGRTRHVRWGNRSIDLDIILASYNGQNIIAKNNNELILPHPEALNRNFVLVPATEIAGDWIHPTTGRTLEEERKLRDYQLDVLHQSASPTKETAKQTITEV